MTAAFGAALALWMSCAACVRAGALHASSPRAEPGIFRGVALSLGPGRPVCARATFDRRKAADGGFVFIVDAADSRDENAIRLAEALIARRGGLSSFAGIAARRHGVASIALGRGIWDPQGPSLSLDEPVFGPMFTARGVPVRAATGFRPRVLREGDAVCVDAAAGRVLVPPAEDAEAVVDAAQAAEAYDGLRDAGALERWLEADPNSRRAAALAAELAPRALSGSLSAADFSRLMSAARRAAGPGQARVDAAAREAWELAARRAAAALGSCPEDAALAPSRAALERLSSSAKRMESKTTASARVLGASEEGVGKAARACVLAVRRRWRVVPSSSPSLEDAAAAAGAERVQAAKLPDNSWKDFVSKNGLSAYIAQELNDASLDLRRKSERLRARILEARLQPDSPPGRAAVEAAGKGACLVIGEDAQLKTNGADVLRAVVEVWAASWAPGPLGARMRQGRGLQVSGRIRVEKLAGADASGLAFSRDPGSGLRGRIAVEAVRGGPDTLLSGAVLSDRFVLDARSGRALDSSPVGEKPVLSAKQLSRLARLARALDAWSGGGVELAFSLAGSKLYVHYARPLMPPQLPSPVFDPFSPRPSAEALSVSPVR